MRLCGCGCGKPTKIAKYPSRKFGYKAGEYRIFLHGHSQVKTFPAAEVAAPLCACGCKKPVGRYTRSKTKLGAVKENFFKYHIGHVARKSPVVFCVEWHGHTSACWVWKMSIGPSGYGYKGNKMAHRYYWEKVNGPVPIGLELDHLCSTRACMRPDHLEPVTRSENMLRAFAKRRLRKSSVQSAYGP
jgi:hypothetical protein